MLARQRDFWQANTRLGMGHLIVAFVNFMGWVGAFGPPFPLGRAVSSVVEHYLDTVGILIGIVLGLLCQCVRAKTAVFEGFGGRFTSLAQGSSSVRERPFTVQRAKACEICQGHIGLRQRLA